MATTRRQVPRSTLFAALRRAWARDTSTDSEWSGQCPSRGQCAVTALVVQDYLGGRLLRADVEGISHYWNRVANTDIDLTRDQFAEFSPVNVTERGRDYVLSFRDTLIRYETIQKRVALILFEEQQDAGTAATRDRRNVASVHVNN